MKVLVANRGAIARRVIRACQALGYSTVAVYSDPDAGAPHLAEASESFRLSGLSAKDTYLNQSELLRCAAHTRCTAVHPGYGFLSENADFANAVEAVGMVFIGPKPVWLRELGDKVAARRLFAQKGFPVFAGSDLLQSTDDVSAIAADIGYPVLVKPSGGGGGMGMEVVTSQATLDGAIARASAIAEQAFGRSQLYLEKWLEQPRHIEFQVLGDLHGKVMHLYERECSIQRRNQKLIEESPAPGIDSQKIMQTAELAENVCHDLGYDNAGTVETLFTPASEIGFLEMNTRIQVEHGVTEMVTGLDLVQQQILLAHGGHLPDRPPRQGYAVEVRLYAEDSRTLLPSTGRLSVFRPPKMSHVRIETGYQEGQDVTPYYDALLAKVIAWGETRELAIGRCVVALRAFTIRGVATNAALLTEILKNDSFLDGSLHTGLLAEIMAA